MENEVNTNNNNSNTNNIHGNHMNGNTHNNNNELIAQVCTTLQSTFSGISPVNEYGMVQQRRKGLLFILFIGVTSQVMRCFEVMARFFFALRSSFFVQSFSPFLSFSKVYL